MAAKKFDSISKMAEYMTKHPIMQRSVVMISGHAYNTSYLRRCVDQLALIEMKARIGEVPSPLERLGLELLMQVFDVESATPKVPVD